MWFLNNNENGSSPRIKDLRATVACQDAMTEVIPATTVCGRTTPAPDIDDGGDLDRGNRQIHPNTGATCD